MKYKAPIARSLGIIHMCLKSSRLYVDTAVALAVLATRRHSLALVPPQFVSGSDHPGGRLNIVNYLDTVIWNSAPANWKRACERSGEHDAPIATNPAAGETGTENTRLLQPKLSGDSCPTTHEGFNLAHAAEADLVVIWLAEWLFIVISSACRRPRQRARLVVLRKEPAAARSWRARLKPLYLASLQQYWCR